MATQREVVFTTDNAFVERVIRDGRIIAFDVRRRDGSRLTSFDDERTGYAYAVTLAMRYSEDVERIRAELRRHQTEHGDG